MRTVLVDSSTFLSQADPDEPSHTAVATAVEALRWSGAALVTTNFVFDETYTLMLRRLGRPQAVAWGESVRNSRALGMIRVEEDHEAAAWSLLLAFADKDFSYTDATSFAVTVAFGIEEAVAVDRHFHQYGRLRVVPAADR